MYEATTERYGPEVSLLSCSLPTPGPTEPARTRAFLEGLLPEGQALAAMAARIRSVRLTGDGGPASVDDAVNLLAEYGRECAGAVVILPRGEPYEPRRGGYQPVSDDDLASLIRDLPDRPLGADPDREVRMSLAGAQSKLLLARFDDRWHQPLDGAASTHILKPTTTWADSAPNEALVMTVAKDVGLTPSSSWVEIVAGQTVLVTERFDRAVVGRQLVRRRHQEDMCQAVGLRPVDKYAIGRPSDRMARLLREQTSDPATEILRLFRQVCFRAIVGDEDGHGKNYSLYLDAGHVTLAPLYDCLCTVVFTDLSGRMGAPLGRQQNLAKVDSAALVEEAVAMGIPGDTARTALAALAADMDRAIDHLPPTLTTSWDSDPVLRTIRERIRRLNLGEPMGGAAPLRRRR